MHVKLTSTWAEHCPAYFLAISLEKKEVIISVRGTAQVEDVITDLTALPRVRIPDEACKVLESNASFPLSMQDTALAEIVSPGLTHPPMLTRMLACGDRNGNADVQESVLHMRRSRACPLAGVWRGQAHGAQRYACIRRMAQG